MDQSFRSGERLRQKKVIQQLFRAGKVVKAFPLMAFYLERPEDSGVKVAFAVSRKKLKRAVDRNRTKRLLREAYRTQRPEEWRARQPGLALILVYTQNTPPEWNATKRAVAKVIQRLE